MHWRCQRSLQRNVQPVVAELKNQEKIIVGIWESEVKLQLSHLTIIMSSKRPSETKRIGKKRKLTGSFEGGILSPLRLSPAPTPSSIEMDSSFDNQRWIAEILFSNISLKQSRSFKVFCHSIWLA